MANNTLYNSSLANLYRSIGLQRGVSPAFINASIAQGIAESNLDPNAIGDNGSARGLHQWRGDRQKGVDFGSPEAQVNHWYDENKYNFGITDPYKANAAAIASERPAGWKPGDPTGVPSYNKRLGDTLALMRFQGYQPNPQDPSSMMALGSDSLPQVGGDIPNIPVAPQSISLGDQGEAPLNNIGSTLANMGASIASLDNRGTGIASLNASRVASNLQAQEAAREKQIGWKYQGQTDNKQGFVFSNGKEMKVIPADPAFAGNKSDETSLQKDFAWAGSDPVKMKLVNAAHGIEDKPEMDDSLKSDLGSLWAAGDDTIMSRQDAKSRQEIMAAGIKQIRDAGLDPKEVMANRIAYKGDLADDKRRSTIIGALDTYKGEFLAGAKQAAEYAKKVPDDIQMKPLREAYQWAQKNAGTEAGKAINDLQVALESMNRGYNRAVSTSSNGNVTGEKRIAELFNPALPTKMILSGIGVLTGDVTRLNKFAVEARDNARARRAGKAIPHPEIEDEDKAIQSILGDAPKSKEPAIRNSAAAPSNIRNANDLNNWIQSSGLKKGDKFTLPDGTEGIVP